MLQRILIPLDGSPLAEQALTYAAEISVLTGARLVLVRAARAHTLPGVDPRERQSGAVGEAEDYLNETATQLVERGYACEALAPYGQPAQCIVDTARLGNADLIVMTTHGRTGPGRLVFGSVAESVVAGSPVPVLLARSWLPPQRRPFLPDQSLFVVPLDGSPFAECALQPAVHLADEIGAGLVLVRAGVDDDALDYLLRIRVRLAEQFPDMSVLTDVRETDAPAAIDESVRQTGASLVFMATHGRGGITRSVTGSVAGSVLHQGRVPVVLVRPTRDSVIESPDQMVGASA